MGSAGAFLSRLEYLVATFEAMARFGAAVLKVAPIITPEAGSGPNGDDLPRFEVN